MSGGKIYLEDGVDIKKEEQIEKGKKVSRYFFRGIQFFEDDGRFYLLLHRLEDGVPETVKDVVGKISFYEWFLVEPERTRGRYELESASATVDLVSVEKKDKYVVRITSKTMEDARELYYAIRAGEILPTESWEEKQVEPISEMRVKFDRGAAGYKPFIEVTFPDWQVLTFRSGSMKDNFHKITTPERNKAIALCEQAIIEMGEGNCPQVYRNLYYEICHGKRRQ
jgi:hypothetical protein